MLSSAMPLLNRGIVTCKASATCTWTQNHCRSANNVTDVATIDAARALHCGKMLGVHAVSDVLLPGV
jgi:hypothetical protein